MNAPIITDLRPDRTRTYAAPKPILDRILVRQLESSKTEDGFIVPEKYRQKTNRGEVIAIGDWIAIGQNSYPITDFVNIGDIVHYGEYCAEAQKDDPTTFIVRLQDIRQVERLNRE